MSSAADEGKTPSVDRAALASSTMAHWSEGLTSVIETMTGSRPKIQSGDVSSYRIEEGIAWWGQSLSLLEQPSFWIGAPADAWTQLGRLILSALGVDEASDADIEATCRDLMAQTAATVATQLTSQFAETVSSGDSVPAAQPNIEGAAVFTWSLDAGSMTIQGTAIWAEAFLTRCSAFTPQPAEEPAAPEPPPDRAEDHSEDHPLELGGHPVDSIPRLDLRAKFILGRTTLPLREVFKLNVGSVIELDRLVTEPADVVIHGRLLARGQVVIVNGNYGLKIMPHQ